MPAAIAIPAIATAVSGGVAAGATIHGSKQANRASRRASEATERSNAEAMALERERDAEARRQWEAEQEMARQQLAAQEEERAYRRQQDEYQQQLLREREARMAPYRQMSAAALGNLGNLLGIDLGNTALAQNLAAPRTMPPSGGPSGQRGMPGINDGPRGGPVDMPGGWGTSYGRGPDGMMRLPSQPHGPQIPPGVTPTFNPMTPGRRQLPMTMGDFTGLRRRTEY